MATQAGHATWADLIKPLELWFFPRIRRFLWLWSGLFSAASFAIPMIGVVAFARTDGVVPSFLAAVASAALFGVASRLRFGPESA